MIWLIISLISNVIEQLLIVHVMSSMEMVTFIALFYLFSMVFTFGYHLNSRKSDDFMKWTDINQNKFLFGGYIGGAFLGNLFWFMAILMIGVGMTAFILVFIKILTTSYSYKFMQDRFTVDKAISFAVGILALLVFSFSGAEASLLGVALAFMSCFGFASEVIFRKKLVDNNVNPASAILTRATAMFGLWGVIFLSGVIIGTQSFANIISLDITTLLLIILTAFIGGFIVHLAIFLGMKNVKVSQYESLMSIKPVLLALGGVFFFSETITLMQSIAGAVIILSTFYFLKSKKAP
ncbi:MAG: DMT family transporter [Pseudomonadota bacterium]